MAFANRQWVTFGILSGLFLTSMEISVVGTAAPMIVHDLGGLDSYSWMFTNYLLTATLSMPVWGRASDQLGRKKLFLISMGIFLIGATLCGLAQNMVQLNIFRAVKGLGAGGIIPLAFTLIADIYPYHERGRVQGSLSSTWGIASVIGPFIGGGLTEIISWRAIFFVSLIPGFVSFACIGRFFRDTHKAKGQVTISTASLISATAGVGGLLLAMKALQDGYEKRCALFIAASITAILLFIRSERRVEHPLIPRALRAHRIFIMSCITGFFCSVMIIGLSSFGPLLFQSVMKHTPTESGLMLTPFTLAWVFGSVISTRCMLKFHYRTLLLGGIWTTFLGFAALIAVFKNISDWSFIVTTAVMGLGMAFNYPIALITTQHSVSPEDLGFATSGMSWIRNIGTTIGSSVMGLTLSLTFWNALEKEAPVPGEIRQQMKRGLGVFLADTTGSLPLPTSDIMAILHASLFNVFLLMFVAVGIALALSYWFPKGAVTIQERKPAIASHSS